MLYLVSYDLKGGDTDDYQELYQAFNEYDDSIRALESSWLIETNKDCMTIRDELRAKMKTHDLIIVVPYGVQRASWLPSSVVDWIREKTHKGK